MGEKAAKKEEKKAEKKLVKKEAKAEVAKKKEDQVKAKEDCDEAENAKGKGAKKAKKIVQMTESGIAFWEAKLRTVPALLKTKTDVQSMLPILRDEHKWKKKIEELKKAEKEGTKKALKGNNL